jgi:hypothetical protein
LKCSRACHALLASGGFERELMQVLFSGSNGG